MYVDGDADDVFLHDVVLFVGVVFHFGVELCGIPCEEVAASAAGAVELDDDGAVDFFGGGKNLGDGDCCFAEPFALHGAVAFPG